MKYLHRTLLSFALVIFVYALVTPAHAATSYTNAALLAQIQLLKAQLAALEQQLALQSAALPYTPTYTSTYTPSSCYTDIYGSRYCVTDTQYYGDVDDIDSIEVDFVGDIAQVRVEFDDGDTEFYAFEADTITEMAQRLSLELHASVASIIRLTDEIDGDDRHDDDDIRSIDVTFDGDDADVVVRFRDGDTDRFTLHDVDEDEDEVIELLADRYDMDEDDIKDVIDFD